MPLKSFIDYVKEQEREYPIRIKTIVPLDDRAMEYIERVLDKYVPKDITKPVKTIMQKHPLDFSDIKNAEVWIVDITTALPVSAYVLMQELKLALNIPEKYIVVRNANDPREVENQRQASNDEIDMASMEGGYSPTARLSTNASYDDDELGELSRPVYGNDYNSEFLTVLAQVAAERQKFAANPDTNDLDQGGTVVDDEVQANDFNDHIADAPKPVYTGYAETLKKLRKKGKLSNPHISNVGNFDDDEIQRTKKVAKYGVDDKDAVYTIKNEKEGIRKK